MFQLTREELESVKSQFATSRITSLFEGQEDCRRKLYYRLLLLPDKQI